MRLDFFYVILFILGLHLLQSRGYLFLRGELGSQRQKGLGDKTVGVPVPPRGHGQRGEEAPVVFSQAV